MRAGRSTSLPSRTLGELVVHLARRQLDARHRGTLLGWLWPLARQLAQLAVLVFVFSHVLDLGIENFALFVFTGLIAWSWFTNALTEASTSLLAHRQFAVHPRFPPAVVPGMAVAVPLADVLVALPVLVLLAGVTDELHLSVLGLIPVLLVELVLLAGLAWLLAVGTVFLRDVPQLTGVALTLLFYLTPVFYGRDDVPERYRWVLDVNPLATLIEAARAAVMGTPWPSAGRLLAVAATAALVAALGLWVFHRLQHELADRL